MGGQLLLNKPWSYQIELHHGCQLSCKMCGLRGVPRVHEDMDFDVAQDIARQIGAFTPNARIEFAMRGEPLLNPRWAACVDQFRQALPKTQLMLTTNGLQVRGHWGSFAHTASVAGLNIIIVDLYEPYGQELRSEIEEDPGEWGLVDFYRDEEGWSPWHNHGHKGHTVVLMDDIQRHSGEKSQRTIFNHAGNGLMGKKLDAPLNKICTNPFREVAVQYDGSVPVCCMDYGRELVVGNVTAEWLPDVWYGEKWMAARRILFERRRPMAPCCRCDHPSGPRVGLIPKQKPATEDDERLIRATNAASPRVNGRAPEWVDMQVETGQ
jgi:hypothetical protein